MSCLEFALLSRSPISLKKEPRKESRDKGGERGAGGQKKNKTQQSTRPPGYIDAHTHTHTLWCFHAQLVTVETWRSLP